MCEFRVGSSQLDLTGLTQGHLVLKIKVFGLVFLSKFLSILTSCTHGWSKRRLLHTSMVT